MGSALVVLGLLLAVALLGWAVLRGAGG